MPLALSRCSSTALAFLLAMTLASCATGQTSLATDQLIPADQTDLTWSMTWPELMHEGEASLRRGDTAIALEMLSAALRLAQSIDGGIPTREHAALLDLLAEAHHARGLDRTALGLFTSALELRKNALGEEHPDLALSYLHLSDFYSVLGERGKALALLQRTEKLQRHALGDHAPAVAATLCRLSYYYRSPQDGDKAEEILLEALQIAEGCKATCANELRATLAALAGLMKEQGRSDEETAYRKRRQAIPRQ